MFYTGEKKTASAEPTPIKKEPVVSEDYVTVTNDATRNDPKRLISYIPGQPWTIPRYFSQYLEGTTEVEQLNLGKDVVFQQYIEIKDLEVRVTSKPTPNMVSDGRMEMEGELHVYAGFTPNVGDMFLAYLSDGKLYCLTVNEPKRLTHLAESVHSVTFKIIGRADQYVGELENKTIKTLVFNRDFLDFGTNPFLTEESNKNLIDLNVKVRQSIDSFFDDFLDPETEGLIIPDQTGKVYDPYLVDIIQKSYDVRNYGNRHFDVVSMHSDASYRRDTIWDRLFSANNNLDNIVKKMVLVGRRAFRVSMVDHKSPFYAGYNRFVYPTLSSIGENYNGTVAGLEREGASWSTLKAYKALEGIVAPETMPNFRPVEEGDTYIFSTSFYEGEPKSVVETVVLDSLNGNKVDRLALVKLYDSLKAEPALIRFYYTWVLYLVSKREMQVWSN